jgi:anti-anti-sigma regulatory factor
VCICTNVREFNGFAGLKIEKSAHAGMTTIRLIGSFESEQLVELKEQFRLLSSEAKIVLDLKEVTLVDRDVVRFLASYKARGVTLVNWAQYIRDWIRREQA